MASISYDSRSFIVEGRRVWLVSGAVHYFRTPAALWADRLLKAKRAGLNCIETYVAWNFHESQEGKWDFTGDRDVAAFVELAGEMGLYVILRPGPYICSEWDFGGFPAWLTTKSGIAYRTNNATYTHYFDKYFRQLLPRLADLQITRNGKIILIQNENEYTYTTMPDRLSYLEFINQLIRRAGFDIPIINCNWASDPPVPDNIECVNGWGSEIQTLKAQRMRQPNAPLLVTEFWPGWFDAWGTEHPVKSARETARRAMEILGCGGQVSYYMFHGGTNFAFWGSRLASAGDSAYTTTSYDSGGPLAEGGGLTPKFYLTRLVNLTANHMGSHLANCTMEIGANALGVPSVLNLSGANGRWVVVTNNGREDFPEVRVSLLAPGLPAGREITVSVQTFGAAAVPIGLKLTAEHTLDWANCTPLGLFGDKLLVLHAPAGTAVQYSINGVQTALPAPAGDEVTLTGHQGLFVAVINSDLAQITWPLEDSLLLGPSFVGATAEQIQMPKGKTEYGILSFAGELSRKKIKPAPAAPAAPNMAPLKKITGCAELADGALEWTPLDRPRDVDRLGQYYGYVWYRIELEQDKAADHTLFLPECEDRASIFVNGEFAGLWGRDPRRGQAKPAKGSALGGRLGLKVHLARGRNVVAVLLDNLGRMNYGSRLGELKGLYGHIYESSLTNVKPGKPKPVENTARKIVPRKLQHMVQGLEASPQFEVPLDLALRKVAPVHLSFTDLPRAAALSCNGRIVAFWEGCGGFGDFTLRNELVKGKNELTLLLWGEVKPETLANVRLHLLEENLTQDAKWSWRPWEMPSGKPLPAAAGMPAWYSTTFKHAPARIAAGTELPLFVEIKGAGKGQLFINGHNAGRFWTIGPQEYYYLPECWLEAQNELKLFVEHGEKPQVNLEYRPQGPFGE